MTLSSTSKHTRWIHEVEVDEVINAKFLQLQHNGTEIRPENLRVSVVLHLLLVRLLRVQSETLAGTCTTSAASPLLRTGLTDGSHQQRLHTNTRIVHLHVQHAHMYIYICDDKTQHIQHTIQNNIQFNMIHTLLSDNIILQLLIKIKQEVGKNIDKATFTQILVNRPELSLSHSHLTKNSISSVIYNLLTNKKNTEQLQKPACTVCSV